ncbi:MAG: DUF5985 family protein [Hyphomonadaceae bacterium]
MPALVYTLCFVTSAVCAALLFASYFKTRTRLLFWSAISFVCLAINNFFVLGDLVLFPDINLLPMRYAAAFAAVCSMIYGFIWETE